MQYVNNKQIGEHGISVRAKSRRISHQECGSNANTVNKAVITIGEAAMAACANTHQREIAAAMKAGCIGSETVASCTVLSVADLLQDKTGGIGFIAQCGSTHRAGAYDTYPQVWKYRESWHFLNIAKLCNVTALSRQAYSSHIYLYKGDNC